jgi:hypothetical protein
MGSRISHLQWGAGYRTFKVQVHSLGDRNKGAVNPKRERDGPVGKTRCPSYWSVLLVLLLPRCNHKGGFTQSSLTTQFRDLQLRGTIKVILCFAWFDTGMAGSINLEPALQNVCPGLSGRHQAAVFCELSPPFKRDWGWGGGERTWENGKETMLFLIWVLLAALPPTSGVPRTTEDDACAAGASLCSQVLCLSSGVWLG